jgi:type II secretory ATPase GspE/PulE/Tfp pilus assembly ATPase PilB-like protein
MVCEECAEAHLATRDELERLGGEGRDLVSGKFRRGRGCDACAGTGYRGRTGIYELMPMSEGIRALLVQDASLDKIRSLARQQGMQPLRSDGYARAAAGLTTLEEVLRVSRDEVTE